jgi:hypothetical protein
MYKYMFPVFEQFEDPRKNSNVYVHGSMPVVEQEGSSNFNMKKTQVLLDGLSQTLKCSVTPYVTGSLTKCYFYEFLFMQVLTHDKMK